jgi:lambda family phage portal protein
VWPFNKKTVKKVGKETRVFQSAMIDRLKATWTTSSQSIDWDLRTGLPVIRARARNESQNNPYAKKFLQMCATHVVGPSGFSLQVRIKEQNSTGKTVVDKLASDAIEKAFWEWANRGNCDVTGRLSFFDIQNLYIKSVARDGEVLIRKVYGSVNKFGFALQILDIDRLDTNKNEELNNGHVIKMGVEINRFGRPVAYWLRTSHPGDNPYYTNTGSSFERVPAEDIYHHFIAERPEQNRGIPWMHGALVRLKNLDGYEEAAVIAARVGAAKMGHYTSPEGDGTALADDESANGQLMTDAEAGVFQILPPGYDFKSFDPDYPHAMFSEFVKANLRGVASGLGVAYNTLSNDLEGVNFSSIRTGVLEERDNWMVIQNWMIEQFMTDVFATWLKFALLNKAVTMPNGSALPVSKFDKFNQATWQGRRWQWVDPKADIEANIAAINNGLKCRADVIAEQGKDIEDVFTSLQSEQEMIATMGIEIAPVNPNQAASDAANAKQDQNLDQSKAMDSNQSAIRDLETKLFAAHESVEMFKEQATNFRKTGSFTESVAEIAQKMGEKIVDSQKVFIESVRDTVENMPITVNVAAPAVTVEAPNVTVEPAQITIEAQMPAPEITLSMPDRRKETTVERDSRGEITKTTTIETDA